MMNINPKTQPNAYLIINSEVFPLNKEIILIGRKLDNDIVIHDPRISRSHAQIRLVEGHFVLLDMNSTGGSYINNQKISKSVLYSGDTISLAGVEMKYVQDAPRIIKRSMDRTGPINNVHFKENPTQIMPRSKDIDNPDKQT